MKNTKEGLQIVRANLLSLLEEEQPISQETLTLKLESIWKDILKLIVVRNDSIEAVQALCDDMINMLLAGGCRREQLIICTQGILTAISQPNFISGSESDSE